MQCPNYNIEDKLKIGNYKFLKRISMKCPNCKAEEKLNIVDYIRIIIISYKLRPLIGHYKKMWRSIRSIKIFTFMNKFTMNGTVKNVD